MGNTLTIRTLRTIPASDLYSEIPDGVIRTAEYDADNDVVAIVADGFSIALFPGEFTITGPETTAERAMLAREQERAEFEQTRMVRADYLRRSLDSVHAQYGRRTMTLRAGSEAVVVRALSNGWTGSEQGATAEAGDVVTVHQTHGDGWAFVERHDGHGRIVKFYARQSSVAVLAVDMVKDPGSAHRDQITRAQELRAPDSDDARYSYATYRYGVQVALRAARRDRLAARDEYFAAALRGRMLAAEIADWQADDASNV